MRQENRERGPEPTAALSNDAPLIPEDERIAEALALGLGRLRTARPGVQEALETRLLDRLAVPARPWWRRALPSRSRVRQQTPDTIRMPRRSFVGLAAASALVLAGASISLPLVGTPEVSAREILEKVQANSENPMLAGVKSFHLTAKMWADHSRFGKERTQRPGPHEMMTEQWFVSPDRMRTESRTRDSNGKTVVSGMMSNGSDYKHYVTEGATDVFMISVFMAPIGAKPSSEVRVERDVQEVRPTASPGAGVQQGAGLASGGVRVAPPKEARAEDKVFAVAVASRKPDGTGDEKDEDQEVFVVGEGCAEPKRTGEATVAGRPVFVVENDFSACLPANAPSELKGRHVRWVDQKTFLPLKMEMYDQSGALVDRYEVTSIEYDVDIPAKTFSELPAGTKEQAVPKFPVPPSREDAVPGRKPTGP
jgi:outer membrane lipoprotein-sorting protein